jgi:predicted ATPase
VRGGGGGKHFLLPALLSFLKSQTMAIPSGVVYSSLRRSRSFLVATRYLSGGPVTERLQELVAQGETLPDPHQTNAAVELDRLYNDLRQTPPPSKVVHSSANLFGTFFGGSDDSLLSSSDIPATTGAYLYGGVGCGKTFLMNLLFHSIDSSHPWHDEKQKIHYHKFMLNVHQHMHQVRQSSPHTDLLQPVVESILSEGKFLCLDEFQVTDVADALILQRLFQGLWRNGCVLVATSNRPPQDLYLHGLQRDRFLPFISLLQQNCTIVNMLDSNPTDYRRLTPFITGLNPVYFTNRHKFQSLFDKLTKSSPTNPTSLTTQGRKVEIPLASTQQNIAHFSFQDLCQTAMGAADYLVIAQNFETVFLHSIPKLTIHHINWLRRFITFVDTMYELNVTLVLHTNASSIDDIFVVENKQDYSQDEVFAFDRSRSRLEEMASRKYLAKEWLGDAKNLT